MAVDPEQPQPQAQAQATAKPKAPLPVAAPSPLDVVVVPATRPVEIVVVDTPASVPQTATGVGTVAKLRQRIPLQTIPGERPRVPGNFWVLLAVACVALVFTWHWVISPLVVHAEHSLQRRIYGERTYDAPTSNPHVRRQKPPIFGHRIW